MIFIIEHNEAEEYSVIDHVGYMTPQLLSKYVIKNYSYNVDGVNNNLWVEIYLDNTNSVLSFYNDKYEGIERNITGKNSHINNVMNDENKKRGQFYKEIVKPYKRNLLIDKLTS